MWVTVASVTPTQVVVTATFYLSTYLSPYFFTLTWAKKSLVRTSTFTKVSLNMSICASAWVKDVCTFAISGEKTSYQRWNTILTCWGFRWFDLPVFTRSNNINYNIIYWFYNSYCLSLKGSELMLKVCPCKSNLITCSSIELGTFIYLKMVNNFNHYTHSFKC